MFRFVESIDETSCTRLLSETVTNVVSIPVAVSFSIPIPIRISLCAGHCVLLGKTLGRLTDATAQPRWRCGALRQGRTWH